MRFVALLRGINVGGANKLPMADLRKLVEGLGHTDVETLGASGNVLFTASGTASQVHKGIEAAVSKKMGKPMSAVLRSRPQWRKVLDVDPFPKKVTDDMRLSVTFLRETTEAELPDVPGIEVLHRTPTEFYAVWRVVNGRPPAFTKHEKALGVASTTRFWTVVKDLGERLDT